MVFARNNNGIALGKILLTIIVVWVSTLQAPERLASVPITDIAQGNAHFNQRDFSRAVQYYEAAFRQNPVWFRQNPLLLGRLAMAYYQSQQFERAQRLFRHLQQRLPEITDHLQFFELKALLHQYNTVPISRLRAIERALQNSPLQSRVDSLLGEHYWRQGKTDSAFFFLLKAIQQGKQGSEKELQRLILKADSTRQIKIRLQLSRQYIRRFPFTDFALSTGKWLQHYLQQHPDITLFRETFRFLIRRKQLAEAQKLLYQIGRILLNHEQQARYQVKLQYARGNYRELLEWISVNRSRYREMATLQQLDLHRARCYLRLGEVDLAIQAYLDFQKRYPTAKIAPEVLWKVANLYESHHQLEAARQQYQRLARRYPHSEFYRETVLRIGLMDYRRQRFKRARQYWQTIVSKAGNEDFRTRLVYWIAKTYLAQGQLRQYWQTLATIAEEPFQNYYTLKAYLIVKAHSMHNAQIDSLIWSIPFEHVSTVGQFFEQFQRFRMLHYIFGEPFSRGELRRLRRHGPARWEYYYALAELAERVGWYHVAFAIYRDVFFTFFKEKPWESWRFLLKKLYPFYYQEAVESAARQWDLPPALIWAVMKKESSFQPDAISYANAHGLMQLIPATAQQVSRMLKRPFKSVYQLYEPSTNILLGSYYIHRLRQQFNGNWYSVLAAYNAGPNRVTRWRGASGREDDDLFMETIEFEQTRRYVRVVMRYYWTYALLLNPDVLPQEILPYMQEQSRLGALY